MHTHIHADAYAHMHAHACTLSIVQQENVFQIPPELQHRHPSSERHQSLGLADAAQVVEGEEEPRDTRDTRDTRKSGSALPAAEGDDALDNERLSARHIAMLHAMLAPEYQLYALALSMAPKTRPPPPSRHPL